MTLLQLKYIVAIDTHKNFAVAAERCFVTQPTLSMQVQKLEEELGVVLFDRSRKPVVPTSIGRKIIEQARVNLREFGKIQEIIEKEQSGLSGELKIGIIPTLAPYLLPLFVTKFLSQYPAISLVIEELMSNQILARIGRDQLDFGILVTPTNDERMIESPLFYESFVVYMSTNHPLSDQSVLDLASLNLDEMLLLSEGHCFRNQVINICPKHRDIPQESRLKFESGSLETLKRIIENRYGYTLLPELATFNLNELQRRHIKILHDPKPVREVSIVSHKSYLKTQLVELFKKELLASIPKSVRSNTAENLVEWV